MDQISARSQPLPNLSPTLPFSGAANLKMTPASRSPNASGARGFPTINEKPDRLRLPQISNNFNQQPRDLEQGNLKLVEVCLSDNPSGSGTTSTISSEGTASVPNFTKQPPPEGRVSYASIMQKRVDRPPDLPAHKFSALKAEKLADGFSLTIPKQMYQKRIAEFKFSVIGRVLLRKGSKPQATHQLKLELNNLWGIQSEWKLLTLGKGFFTMKFSTLEDKKLAKAKIVWDLPVGSIRLRDWVPCFNPYKEVSSICQVWVRIYYLPNEFWDPEVITAIARIIGFPIKIDGVSAHGEVGHFIRVLIEVDLAQPLQESMLIDCEHPFYVEFSYEQLPFFCSNCRITGHQVEKCTKLKQKDSQDSKEALEADQNVATPIESATDNENKGKKVSVKPKAHLASTFGKTNAKPAEAWSKVAEQAVKKQIVVPVLEKEAVETRNAFQALDLENNAETCLDMGVDPISGTSFGVHLSEPDLLEKNLVPIQGDKDVTKDSDLVINEEDSDVEETLEMEAPDGAGLNRPIIDDTAVALERDPSLDKSGGAPHEGNKDLSALGPDNIASRINRLEEQVSQGMQLLSDKTTKRGRGRPKGTGKGMEREQMQAVPEGSIKGRLRNAGEMGYKPRNFVVDCSNSDSMSAMNNIVHRRWSDEMDDYPDLWDH